MRQSKDSMFFLDENISYPKLSQLLKASKEDIDCALDYFNLVTDNSLIDHAIYNLGAKTSKYEYLISISKTMKISDMV